MNIERAQNLVELPRFVVHQPFDRWADTQFDGTLELIDHTIDTMVSCAQENIDSCQEDEKEEMLYEIEWSAYAVAAKLQHLAALSSGRQNALLLDAGTLLCDAVGQYLSLLPNNVRQAILAGVEQAERYVDIPATKLSPIEIEWQQWLLPQLSAHLVLSF